MATIAATVETIAAFALTVGGVTPILRNSYGADDKATDVSRESLPCAITLAAFTAQGRTESRSVMGGSHKTTVPITQYVLFAPADRQLHQVQPRILAYMDAFNVALQATPFYTANSAPSAHNLPHPTFANGEIVYGGVAYHGIEYTYIVELNL